MSSCSVAVSSGLKSSSGISRSSPSPVRRMCLNRCWYDVPRRFRSSWLRSAGSVEWLNSMERLISVGDRPLFDGFHVKRNGTRLLGRCLCRTRGTVTSIAPSEYRVPVAPVVQRPRCRTVQIASGQQSLGERLCSLRFDGAPASFPRDSAVSLSLPSRDSPSCMTVEGMDN